MKYLKCNYQVDKFLHLNQQPDNFVSFLSKVVESNVTLCYIFIIQMLEKGTASDT